MVHIFALSLVSGITLLAAGCLPEPRQTEPADPEPFPSVVDISQDVSATGFPDGRKIGADPRGHLYVVYRKQYTWFRTPRLHIFAAMSRDGGASWTRLNDDRPIESVGDYNQRVPSITVDQNAFIHVVWYGNDSDHTGLNERQIKYVRSVDGGENWSGWQNIAPVADYDGGDLWQEHPVVYTHADGTLYVVWQGRDSEHTYSQTKISRSSDNGLTWSAWANINPSPDTNFSRPSLVALGDGTLIVVAYSQRDSVQQIVWTRSDDRGEDWSSWRPVFSSDRDQRHLSLVADISDHLHVVWRQQAVNSDKESGTLIHYATFDGRSWSRPIPIAANATGFQFFPSMSVDERDRLWVTWSESPEASGVPEEEPLSGDIHYAIKQGERWEPPAQLTHGLRSVYPTLRWQPLLPGENVDIIWLEIDNGLGTIFYDVLQPVTQD